MTDRIVELESTVAHMEATVDGLREELVDANERIRTLERELAELRDGARPEPDGGVVDIGEEANGNDEEQTGLEDIIVA